MRFLSILIIVGWGATNLFAQSDCYTKLRQQGIDAYSNADYDLAIIKWDAAKSCSNSPASQDLHTWLNKAESAKKCKISREEAEKAYSVKDYETAIALWKDIIAKCGDIINTADLQKRISTAEKAAAAETACSKLQEDGQTAFDSKGYAAAIDSWSKALKCSNISETEKSNLKALIGKADVLNKCKFLKVEAQAYFNQREYELASQKYQEVLNCTTDNAEKVQLRESISQANNSIIYIFVIRPVKIICINIDDGTEIRSGIPPKRVIDRDGEIFGQMSMEIQNGGSSQRTVTPFWKITTAQSMTKGKTYPLLTTYNQRIAIVGNAIKTAQFALITNSRSSDGKANGIYEQDPRTPDDSFGDGTGMKNISLSEVKASGKRIMTCKFKSGSGELDFVYEIEYIK